MTTLAQDSALRPTGIIVFAHGSRDPQWRVPVEAVAEAIRQSQPGSRVSCAYLELCEPALSQAANELIASGAGSLRIFPLFFGVGKHAREDLPALVSELESAHPSVPVSLLKAAGEHDQVIALLASIALADTVEATEG
jgi:sirohydrochlorin cobaltochelatase